MTRKALVTGLVVLGSVLGSASAALADSARATAGAQLSWSWSSAHGGGARATGAVVVRDHREGRYRRAERAPEPVFVPAWVTIGTMSQVYDGEMSFDVGPRTTKFSTIKLQSTGGKSLIQRVEIELANGRVQIVELNKYLMASSPAITIDLAGVAPRAIENVTVVGRNARQSGFRVLAM